MFVPVFDRDPEPGQTRSKNHFESNYDYFSISSRPEMLRVRGLIERWYADFPECERKRSILAELRSRRPEFDDTFFELFLHQLLRANGLNVEPEPTVDFGSRPDFLVTTQDGRRLYVEATHSTGKSKADAADDNRLHTLYDYIDQNLRSPNFFWHVSIVLRGTSEPSPKAIVREL